MKDLKKALKIALKNHQFETDKKSLDFLEYVFAVWPAILGYSRAIQVHSNAY